MTLHVLGDLSTHRTGFRPSVRRVAMVSMHTSPLDQPGVGDAGGMNVYTVELARQLACRGVEVEIFTRSTSGALPALVEVADGVAVRHVQSGPFEGLTKTDLPGQLCTFAREVLRTEAMHAPGYYDVIHSHYWLSGQVATIAADRWGIPLIHSMHTMAKVKNSLLADGDVPEPHARVIGEEQVVDAADLVIANTRDEAGQLVTLYDAEPDRVRVIRPGVNLDTFTPGSRTSARAGLGIALDANVVMFVGRIQPLKAPDVLIKAVAVMLERRPDLRADLVVPVIGGPSGSGLDAPRSLIELAAALGVSDVVRFIAPVEQARLVEWYRAASVVVVPSYNESFGLVAIEAQACGTPVVAARVGGLPTAVVDGSTGVLVDGHDPASHADVIESLLDDPLRLESLGWAGTAHAQRFGWGRVAQETLTAYQDATARLRADAIAVAR